MEQTIVLCGSMQFLPDMQEVAKQLQKTGCEVLLPSIHEEEVDLDTLKQTNREAFVAYKQKVMFEHFAKIQRADKVLVLNYSKRGVDGYIGANTLVEIAIAAYLKKPTYLLYEPAEGGAHDEVIGFAPIVLHGDVHNIFV